MICKNPSRFKKKYIYSDVQMEQQHFAENANLDKKICI